MSRSRLPHLVPLLIGALLSVPVAVSPASAQGFSSSSGSVCHDSRAEVTKRTTSGDKVWIPSSRSAGPFQFGGSQSISYSDGTLTAKTTGSANTVGGTGGVNVGIYQASATYNHQWNKSTTRSTSFSQTFTTTSPTMSRRVNWRWRLYTTGYRFVITKTCHIPAPWIDAGTWYVKREIIVPVNSNTHTFHVETYHHRNWLLTLDGTPIRR